MRLRHLFCLFYSTRCALFALFLLLENPSVLIGFVDIETDAKGWVSLDSRRLCGWLA